MRPADEGPLEPKVEIDFRGGLRRKRSEPAAGAIDDGRGFQLHPVEDVGEKATTKLNALAKGLER